MKTTRTLALAALTALSLGVGTAMAQEGPTVGALTWSDMFATGHGTTTIRSDAAPVVTDMPQAGSSDVSTAGYGSQGAISPMLQSELVSGAAGG